MKKNNSNGFALIVKHHKSIVGIFALLTAFFGWFAKDIKIDASAETLLVKENKLYLQNRINDHIFNPDEFILVAYQPHSGELYSAQSMQDILTLSQQFSTLDRVSKVNSITSVPLISAGSSLNADMNAGELSWESRRYDAENLKEIFNNHPVFTDLLVNEAQTATAIQIVFATDKELSDIQEKVLALDRKELSAGLSTEEVKTLENLNSKAAEITARLNRVRSEEVNQLYEITSQYSEHADFYLGGNYVLTEHLISIIKNDLKIFSLVITASICILLFAIFRDWRWVLTPILCCAVSVAITTGLFALLGFKTTVISSNFIALQLILTLALTIHLIVQYQILAQNHVDKSHAELLLDTIKLKFRPCFYAGITTSIGFASLLLSNIQPVITFGWMMIVAMATSISVSLLLFPAFLSFFTGVLPHPEHAITKTLIRWFQAISLKRPALVMVVSLSITGIMIMGLFRLDVENSFLNYFREDTQVRHELAFIDQEFGGSTPLDIIYSPPNEASIVKISDENIRTLQKIQASLQTSVASGKTMSVVNFTQLATELNDGKPLTEYELDSLYILLDENLRKELIGSYYDPESNSYRINTRIADSTENLDRKAFIAAIHGVMADLSIPSSQYSLSGLFVLYQDILERLFSSQFMTLGFVYLALALMMYAIFRSVKLSIIGLIPNIITTVSVLGIMGWANIPLDLMTITISAIAMGIAVDDTIHFIHHFHEHVEEGTDKAIDRSYQTVGYAILYSTLIITFGFSTLIFSDFIPSVLFGLLTAVAMLVAVITDLTLLPTLLRRFYPTGQQQ